MSNFGQNIRKIRNVKKLSQQAFAELFDLKRATLGAYEEARSEPRIETIIKIANHFSISIDDLLTENLTINKLLRFKEDIDFSGSFYEEQLSSVPCIFPQLEIEYIRQCDDQAFVEELPKLRLPLLSNSRKRAFIVSNFEMSSKHNGITPNDMVIGEWRDLERLEEIEPDALVLVVTNHRLILRKLELKDQLNLVASNTGFDPIELDKKEIKEIWEIKHVFLNHIPEMETDFRHKLSYLEHEIKNLKKYL